MNKKVALNKVFGTPVKNYFSYLDIPRNYGREDLDSAYDKKLDAILSDNLNTDIQKPRVQLLNEAYAVLSAPHPIPFLYSCQLEWQEKNGPWNMQDANPLEDTADIRLTNEVKYGNTTVQFYELPLDRFVLPPKFNNSDVDQRYAELFQDVLEYQRDRADFRLSSGLREVATLLRTVEEMPAQFRTPSQVDVIDDFFPVYQPN